MRDAQAEQQRAQGSTVPKDSNLGYWLPVRGKVYIIYIMRLKAIHYIQLWCYGKIYTWFIIQITLRALNWSSYAKTVTGRNP